jgi:hypothetical protein
MALTIENGTGIAGADSFVTLVEYADTQTDLFGAALDGTDVLKEAALRRAFLYLKSLTWKADYPFPTLGGTIPADVKSAQAILARYEEATPGGLQPTVVPGQQKVLTRVGELSWTVMGQTGADAQRAVVMMAADLLKPFVNDTGNTRFLARA